MVLSDYARDHELQRHSKWGACIGVIILLDIALAYRVGPAALLVLPACAAVYAATFLLLHQRSSTLPSPSAPSWSAQLPAWVARDRGVVLQSRRRAATELPGSLVVNRGYIEWRSSPGSTDVGATIIRWNAPTITGVSVTPVWAISPLWLVHVGGRAGLGDDV